MDLKTIVCLFLFLCLIGCEKDSDTLASLMDEVPIAPTELTISEVTYNSLLLSWIDNNDINLEGYRIYQDSELLTRVSENMYRVENLIPETQYSYAISALAVNGNESEKSESEFAITAKESDMEAPTIPQDLSASNVTTTSVDLSWSSANDNIGVEGYTVYQNGSAIGTTSNISFNVSGLAPSTTYSFTVSAFDNAGNSSSISAELMVTTDIDSSVVKVLVFTKTDGFNHNTKSESAAMVQQIGSILGFDVIVDDIGNEFNSVANLSQYKVIFFTNTSGNTLAQGQRNIVESYAAQGGNFISNHAASDSYGHSTAATVSGNGKGVWDWYAENITGCSVRNNPNHTSAGFAATVSIENANSELTAGISFPWGDNEEWYYWEGGYIDTSFTELLRVSNTGSNSYDAPRMTAQYWERPDGGKSFYTSMGHAKDKYTDAEFIQLIRNAFEYMLL